MEEAISNLGNTILAQSPYLFLTVLAFVGAFFMFKINVKEVHQFATESIKTIEKAYSEAASLRNRGGK